MLSSPKGEERVCHSTVLAADIDPPLVEQVFDIPQRQRKPDIHHDRKLDNLGWRFEVTEWVFAHEAKLE